VGKSLQEAIALIRQYAFSKYLEKIEYAISLANQYVDYQKPWTLKELEPQRMQDVLFTLVEQIYKISKLLYPVIPIAAEKVLKQINANYELKLVDEEKLQDDINIGDFETLFPKIATEDIESFDVCTKN
jgi:methionyl-tRNA synthetase